MGFLMRQNLIVGLLLACAMLLAFNILITLRGPAPVAFGQAVGTPQGQVAIATVQGSGGGENYCWLLDVASQRLTCYVQRGQGIELKGVRQITWDLEIRELDAKLASKRLSVKDIEAEVKKQGKGSSPPAKGKEKEKEPEEEK
jgi:hypothetical protein